MKAVQWLNVLTLLIAGTLAVLLAVVCILYAVWHDASPRIRAEWPLLAATTAVMTLIATLAGAAFQAQRRAASWRALVQALMLVALAGGSAVLVSCARLTAHSEHPVAT